MSLASTYVTATDEYAAFVKAAFHLESRRIVVEPTPGSLPNMEAMVCLDRKGRIIRPPITPFVPLKFSPTSANKRARLDRMWLDCGALLADEFLKHSLRGEISFPPEITDLRPFMWKGFSSSLRYTYVLDFPYDESQMDSMVRKNINKTVTAGFRFRRATKADIPAIIHCIRETEERQGFSYSVTELIFGQAIEIIGEDSFRMYIAIAPNGSLASCRVVLHSNGGVAIDWIAATATEHLKSGATQALIRHALEDVQAGGAMTFDFAGAGLPTVSAAKACWGGRLAAYPTIQQQTLKNLLVQTYLHLRGGLKKRDIGKERPASKAEQAKPAN